jgi:hypothetical protein
VALSTRHRRDFSPAGTSASIAAPTSHSYDSFIHHTSPV